MGGGELSGDSPARPPPLIEAPLYYLISCMNLEGLGLIRYHHTRVAGFWVELR